jgi:hypothetical protein
LIHPHQDVQHGDGIPHRLLPYHRAFGRFYISADFAIDLIKHSDPSRFRLLGGGQSMGFVCHVISPIRKGNSSGFWLLFRLPVLVFIGLRHLYLLKDQKRFVSVTPM